MALAITIKAETRSAAPVTNVARFLDDLVSLYEPAHVFSNPQYERFRTEWGRDRIQLRDDERLYFQKLAYGSLTLIAVAAGGVSGTFH